MDIMHIPPRQQAVQGFPVNRFYTKAESDARFAPIGGGGAVSSVFGRTGAVVAVSGDYTSAQVTESGNLYFTNARAIASTLTGYTSGAGTVSATDTILSAIQKLNGNIGALVTGVSSVNSLTGAVALTGTANRITISAANVFDIAATYVGQASITTVGTLSSGSIPYSLLTGTPTIPTGANPTGTIGLTAVNGSASTFLRSDGAPALSQAIAPTWTGVHTFTPAARSSGIAAYLTINAPADTGRTAATESIGINVVGATRTWADGTVTTQREYLFQKPTYNKTTTSAVFTNAGTLVVSGAPVAGTGVTITHPWALWVQGDTVHFGGQIGATQIALAGSGGEFNDSNNTTGGHCVSAQNTSNGTSAFTGFSMGNDQTVDGGATSHFAGMYFNSSTYTDTTFGTAFAVVSQMAIQNTDGPITYSAQINGATGYHNWLVRGTATTNERMRLTSTELTVGLAGTATGVIRFAGATSNYIAITGVAAGASTTNTLQAVTDTFVYRATTDTLTNKTLTDAVNNISAPGTTTVGYLGIPQNSQSAAYTTVMADAGKHILHPTGDNNARTFTIDSNANVAYPIGTVLTFINMKNTVTIAITSDTMTLANTATTGSRTLAVNGIATAVKITATTWIINGTGLT